MHPYWIVFEPLQTFGQGFGVTARSENDAREIVAAERRIRLRA